MNAIENSLTGFRKIDLAHLSPAGLMKRYDTKFLMPVAQLPALFQVLRPDYDVLEIDNQRIFPYQNLYYDTDDYFFYHQHHDQRLSRYKIRCRNYMDIGQIFFEVKCKTNKKKTIKERMPLSGSQIRPELSQDAMAFARECLGRKNRHLVDDIRPSLWTGYHRMTIANPLNQARVTFDVNLTFSDGSRCLALNHLAIVEFKYFRALIHPEFFQLLKKQHILPVRFSKYCMGLVLMGKPVKHNRFKQTLRYVHKLTQDASSTYQDMDFHPEFLPQEDRLARLAY